MASTLTVRMLPADPLPQPRTASDIGIYAVQCPHFIAMVRIRL